MGTRPHVPARAHFFFFLVPRPRRPTWFSIAPGVAEVFRGGVSSLAAYGQAANDHTAVLSPPCGLTSGPLRRVHLENALNARVHKQYACMHAHHRQAVGTTLNSNSFFCITQGFPLKSLPEMQNPDTETRDTQRARERNRDTKDRAGTEVEREIDRLANLLAKSPRPPVPSGGHLC